MSERDLIDRAKDVREGEALDHLSLQAWLRDRGVLTDKERLAIQQYPAGYSNLTYLLRVEDDAGASLRGLVLRRPPFGNTIKSGHDMGREFRVLSALTEAYPLAPEPLAYCEDTSVIGAPFYVMRKLEGLIMRRQLPKGLDWTPERAHGLSASLIDNLADLHALDYASVGLAELGKPDGYIGRQVEGWVRRYAKAQTDEVKAMDDAGAWLQATAPADDKLPPALIHNDYKYDNVVLDPADPTRIVGVLDWEMATIGSPLMDLGTTLAYWVQADDDPQMKMFAFGPTYQPGTLTRRELVERYASRRGIQVVRPEFYYVFGLYKVSVIIQQIYARYKKGLTKDPRFAPLGHFVQLLGSLAVAAAERESI